MFNYKIKVATGDSLTAGTVNYISIVLVGVKGETPKRTLDHWGKDFLPGAIDEYSVSSKEDIGKILYVRLYKELFLVADQWNCKYVTVISPQGDTYRFPCYQWLSGTTTMEIPEGKGRVLLDGENPVVRQQRSNELEEKRSEYRWRCFAQGAPHCLHEDQITNLNLNDQFSATTITSSLTLGASSAIEIKLKEYSDNTETWKNLCDLQRVFFPVKTQNSEYINQEWKSDKVFGYQFLNGVNPLQIQKCFKIPDNFPVTDEMVAASLGTSTLQVELEKGNLYLADYKILQGIQANTINGQKQYLAAPLCLLWKNINNYIIPIAIQLGQTPGNHVPIFLPSDSEWDWTLAKMWVRNADFQVHEAVSHLLYSHLFAEVFNIATIRQLPMGHPLYKLLIPHFRYTLATNTVGRQTIFNPGGKYDQIASSGKEGLEVLLKRAMTSLTYDSLCLPEDIKSRAVESISNYFYRDDGMKIWQAIKILVSDIIHYHYNDDDSVSKDPELQAWVAEIFKEGFLENKSSGIPSSLDTKVELIRYLTMVIFTCSAKHAAVNSGQFDYYSWMPNAPSSMRKPVPTKKRTATMESILDTLPQVNTTTKTMSLTWVISRERVDCIPLGTYPEAHFTDEVPKRLLQDFKEKLSKISSEIKERNQTMNLTYLYLDPVKIENSISI
ncbi:polyunsaturated fatty acid lipoxygenase ALOX15B-like [Pelobates fuscus]|uniref:polyunsaturated fatty acid lipoxygenase ALOX15B-like n=1 Tax=Pelobates fuscus TaxID=191477 RepID=UPI002FE463C8